MTTQPGHTAEDAAAGRLREYLIELEQAHAQGPARFREVFERPNSGIGVHELDDQAVITRVNPEELSLLGYRESQMVGRPRVGLRRHAGRVAALGREEALG